MKIRKTNKVWHSAMLLCAMLAGCSGLSKSSQQYFVLNSSNQADISFISGEPKVSIRRVQLPDYLNQRTIVRKHGREQIKPVSNQFWAETLSKSIPTVLSQELSVALKSPVEVHPLPPGINVDTIIEIDVFEFIGDAHTLSFKTSYRMVKPKKLEMRNFSTTVDLADASTQALVNGYQTALRRLALDMSKRLL